MGEKKLEKIKNPIVREKLRRIFRNSRDEENLKDILDKGKVKGEFIQTFSDTPSNKIIDAFSFDFSKTENLLLVLEGREEDYMKCIDVVRSFEKLTSGKVMWSFHLNGKDNKHEEIMKVFALGNYF